MELQADGRHLLGADNQHLPPVQGEVVRALPHLAVLVAAGVDLPLQRPVQAVRAAVEQHRAAGVGGAVADGRQIGAVRVPPDFGVPEVQGAAALRQVPRRQNRVAVILLVVQPVADSHALGLDLLQRAVLGAHPAHAGVHQQLPPVGQLQRAAGKAAVGVIFLLVRGQGGGQALPADEVFGLDVPPVHGAPLAGVGVVLVEQVVLPLVDGEAVGVVHPADGRGNVEGGALLIGDVGAVLGFKIAGLLKRFADHMIVLLK